MAVALNMPKLKHLEVSSDWVSNSCSKAIRANCPDLQVLEVKFANDDEDDMYWNERFQERAYSLEDEDDSKPDQFSDYYSENGDW
ncbi:hypothetical protein R1flu_013664 [Riccia fluitans]|uniref:Uncharacterized protein n=1 Tax=Riccia fluitans TaxID=41844 RepID=A0ABD1YE18_9MARC